MRVALVVPQNERMLMHRVRGSGVYASNLIKSLRKNYPRDSFFICSSNNIPDVDIVHYLYFEPFFRTLPIIKKNKTVVTVHDLIPFVFPKDFPAGIKGNINWFFQRLALKNCDAIITDSDSSKKDILKYTGVKEEKVDVVYLAADTIFKEDKSQNSRIKKKYGLPEKFALYVGDVTWNKNLPRILEAIKDKNIPLVLVGKALTREDFDKQNPWNQDLLKVKDFIKDNSKIHVLGFVENNDLVGLYNAATVFVMPSLYEGFGLPVLEALSCGCPVVTSKAGSIPEVAGDAAYYVDAKNINSIANGIEDVYSNDGLMNRLSEKGFLQAKKFSWRKTAELTFKVYQSL